MNKFRQLEWHPHEELKGVYAQPLDLKWGYSIIEHKPDKIEFALLDSYYEYAPNFPQFCNSVVQAQELAMQHYYLVLEHHMAI